MKRSVWIKKRNLLSITAALLCVLFVCAGCTVVRISDGKIISGGSETEAYVGSDEFDAETYIEELWESEAIPFVEENAQEFGMLVESLQQDFKGTGKQYGATRSGNANNYSFLTVAKGTVLEYNDDSRAGYLSLDVEPQDGTEDCKVYVGPVFKGDSLRNALAFIKFTDFKSQNDWAKVSKSLHGRIDETLISQLDLPALVGKTVEVKGAFTATKDMEDVFVTPVTIVAEG